jgi:hypothetical protein
VNIRPVSKYQSNFNEEAELCRSARLELYDKLQAAQKQIDSMARLIEHSELFAELKKKVKADV